MRSTCYHLTFFAVDRARVPSFVKLTGKDHQEGDSSTGMQGVQDKEAARYRALQALRARREEAGDWSPVLSKTPKADGG